MSEVIDIRIPASSFVKRLKSNDFRLSETPGIGLKFPDCILVYFYSETDQSRDFLPIFIKAAQVSTGPVFACCHLILEDEVRQAFARLGSEVRSPYSAYSLSSVPMIITYQRGVPVGIYNGEFQLQPVVDFASTLACRMDYSEPVNKRAGITVTDTEARSVKPALRRDEITTSSAFTSNRDEYLQLVSIVEPAVTEEGAVATEEVASDVGGATA